MTIMPSPRKQRPRDDCSIAAIAIPSGHDNDNDETHNNSSLLLSHPPAQQQQPHAKKLDTTAAVPMFKREDHHQYASAVPRRHHQHTDCSFETRAAMSENEPWSFASNHEQRNKSVAISLFAVASDTNKPSLDTDHAAHRNSSGCFWKQCYGVPAPPVSAMRGSASARRPPPAKSWYVQYMTIVSSFKPCRAKQPASRLEKSLVL
jgi:hypothetical protein